MANARSIVIALGLACAGAAPALGQAPAAPPPGRSCDVVTESRNGGAVEVRPADLTPAGVAAPQVVWRPSATGAGVLLLVTYASDSALRLGEPKGVLIEFHTKADLAPDATSVIVKTASGRNWRFDGQAIHFDKDNRAQVSFGPEWPYGRGVLATIANNQSMTISVEQDGRQVAQESFALTNIDSRETLLAQARLKYGAASTAGCK